MNQTLLAIIFLFMTIMLWLLVKVIGRMYNQICWMQHTISHDLQQIKTRLHWSREREIAHKSHKVSRSNTANYKKIKYEVE